MRAVLCMDLSASKTAGVLVLNTPYTLSVRSVVQWAQDSLHPRSNGRRRVTWRASRQRFSTQSQFLLHEMIRYLLHEFIFSTRIHIYEMIFTSVKALVAKHACRNLHGAERLTINRQAPRDMACIAGYSLHERIFTCNIKACL